MFGDDSGLSFQLASYRWEDDMREARALRARRADAETADVVVAQYNDLVQRFNALSEAANRVGHALDASKAQVDSLQTQVTEKDRLIADLQAKLHAAEQEAATVSYHLETIISSKQEYMSRALAAEAELKERRSQAE